MDPIELTDDTVMHSALNTLVQQGFWGGLTVDPAGAWSLHLNFRDDTDEERSRIFKVGDTIRAMPIGEGKAIVWKES